MNFLKMVNKYLNGWSGASTPLASIISYKIAFLNKLIGNYKDYIILAGDLKITGNKIYSDITLGLFEY